MVTQKRHPNGVGKAIKEESVGKGRGLFTRLYRLFSGLRLSVYILSLMALLLIFEGLFFGDALFLTKMPKTSYILIPAALAFFANLVICAYDTFVNVVGPRAAPDPIKGYTTDHSLLLTQGIAEARSVTKRVLTKELRFKAVVGKKDGWVVMERGLPYRLLTWLYHIGLIVCCIAIALSYLLAYEGSVTLWPGQVDTLAPTKTGRLQSLLGRPPVESRWSIVLDEFSSEYVQAPTLDLPSERRTRLAVGLGWKAQGYSLKKGEIALKGRRSTLRIIKDNRTILDHVVTVNNPMKYDGYTFYQVGFVQSLKVRVNGSPIPLETATDAELFIPGLKGPVKFSTITVGKLHRLDKSVEEIMPYTTVTRTDKSGEKSRRLGRLTFDGSIKIDGKRLTMAGFTQGSVIKYRYDPGVLPLWWGAILVLISMLARFYGAWYRAAYSLTEENGIVRIRLHVSAVGLWANKARLIKSFDRALTRDDIRPTPVLKG